MEDFADRLPEHGALLCQEKCEHANLVGAELSKLAEQAGSLKAVGTVAVAAVCALLGVSREIVEAAVKERFSQNEKLAQLNSRATASGYQAGLTYKPGERFRMLPESVSPGRLWVSGHQAISLGALAGGVRFVAGYPMSPATSILTDLAAWAGEAGVLVEQAEDEVAAINMVAGASYAGTRAMTATSGGGFCLMTEGVSLLGMIEGPAVIILGQRPGPATGLPTRTAQGDLHLVLHAGHGFFPRVILAPRNVPDGFEITARAFDIAEQFQVPVFILTDQLLQDSQASIEPFDPSGLPRERHLVGSEKLASMKSYQRFAQTDSGISPQAAPGSSEHVVVVDSDEHDEDGHLTESGDIAERMAGKRQRKSRTLTEAELLPPPLVDGDVDGRPLVITWGSTYETMAEAKSRLAVGGKELAHLHLRQLWPLPEKFLADLFGRSASLTVVENNVGGELAALLRRVTLRGADNVINRVDGRPFNVAGLVGRLEEALW